MRVFGTFLTLIAVFSMMSLPTQATENDTIWNIPIYVKNIDGSSSSKILNMTLTSEEMQLASSGPNKDLLIWRYESGADPTINKDHVSRYSSFSTGPLNVYVVKTHLDVGFKTSSLTFFLDCITPQNESWLMFLGQTVTGGNTRESAWLTVNPPVGAAPADGHFSGTEAYALAFKIWNGGGAEFWARYLVEQNMATQVKNVCNASPTTIVSPRID